MKHVTIHYRPSCAFSSGVTSFLFLRGADFALENLDEHADEAARLQAKLGNKQLETPCLELDTGELFVAPTMSDLQQLLERWGLPDEAAPHKQLKDAAEQA